MAQSLRAHLRNLIDADLECCKKRARNEYPDIPVEELSDWWWDVHRHHDRVHVDVDGVLLSLEILRQTGMTPAELNGAVAVAAAPGTYEAAATSPARVGVGAVAAFPGTPPAAARKMSFELPALVKVSPNTVRQIEREKRPAKRLRSMRF